MYRYRLYRFEYRSLIAYRWIPGKQKSFTGKCVDSLTTSAEVRLGLFKDALGLALRALDPTSFDDADRRPHAHTDLDVVLGPACELGVLRGGRSTAAITCRKRTPYSHAPTHFKKV